jgi:hypothetical protein
MRSLPFRGPSSIAVAMRVGNVGNVLVAHVDTIAQQASRMARASSRKRNDFVTNV